MLRRRALVAAVFISTVGVWLGRGVPEARAQTPVNTLPTDPAAGSWIRNGISMGRPKVFDNRTLTLMVEALSQQLNAVRFIDQGSVAKALTNFQGSRLTDSAFSLSVSGPSIPGVTNQQTANSATNSVTTDSTGTKTVNTDPNTIGVITTTAAAASPSAPTLQDAQTDTGASLTFGQSAETLLADQVNLSYQIFNLRMILERSLSDRLVNSGPPESLIQPRRQAVLGFNVTINPPAYAVDSAAVVEVTVNGPEGPATSLVAMMPQEKTYNAVAATSKSNSFSGAVFVKAIQVGVAARKASKVMYIFKDNDTLSFENMTRDESGPLQFGWEFRPVLGRRSVSPGLRQMFAVVALPADANVGSIPQNLSITVRTYWKKYKAATATTYTASQVFGLERWRTAFSRPMSLTSAYMNLRTYSGVEVRTPDDSQSALRPVVTDVDWTYTGARSLAVSIRGQNFFTGTSVVLGGKVYRDGSGLTVKSENQIDILTDVDSLVRSDGVIEGRYGGPAVIGQVPGAIPPSWSLINVGPSIGGFRQVDVPFDFDCAALPHYTSAAGGIRMPLVLVEDTVVSDRGNINCNAAGTKGVVGVRVADSLIAGKAPLLQVIFPFWPRAWNYAETLVDVPAVFILERISAEKDSFILRSVTANTFGLAPDQADVDAAIAKLNVELKKAADARVAEEKKNSTQKQSKPASTEPPSVKQPTFDANCITLLYAPGKGMNLPSKDCKDHDPRAAYLSQFSILISSLPDDGKDAFKDRFILLDRKRRAFEVPVPASKPKPKDPALDKTTKITVNQFDTGWISFPGSDLAGIKSAKVTGVALDTRIVPKTAKLPENVQVNLIRTVTDKPGANSVTFYDSDGKFVDTLSFTIRCTACAAAAAKPN